jgi:hypothetical protein
MPTPGRFLRFLGTFAALFTMKFLGNSFFLPGGFGFSPLFVVVLDVLLLLSG